MSMSVSAGLVKPAVDDADSGRESMNIMVVDDSATQAMKLRMILEGHGYNVSVARDGQDALNQAELAKPHVIVSDVMMPGMDGYELCRTLKEHDELSNVPVILVTSSDDHWACVHSLAVGAARFLRKPFCEQDLLALIACSVTRLA